MTRRTLGAGILVFSTLVACGGGGGGTGSVSPPSTVARSASAAFTFTIPLASASSAGRKPRYVSPATRSMIVGVTYTALPRTVTIANFDASAPGCSVTSSGLACVVIVATQDGAQTFVLTAYDGRDGSGNALSTATIPVPPMTGDRTDVPVTLDGIVRTVTFSLQGTFVQGVPATLPLLVIAKDAAGATIVSPGAYTVPLALRNSDAAGSFTLSTASVPGPGAGVTLSYNGASSPGTVISAQTGAASIGFVSVGFGASPGPTPTPSPTASPTVAPTATPSGSPATPTPTPTPAPSPSFPVIIQGGHTR